MVQRLRRELGFGHSHAQAETPACRLPPNNPGHVFSWDFIHDKTIRGGRLKMLTILDEYTREYLLFHVDRLINAQSVRAVMQKLIEQYGPPQYIRSDNGSVPRSETTTCEAIYRNAVADLACCHEYQNHLHRTGKDTLNPSTSGFARSCLNREQLWTLTEARVVIEDWRWLYNNVRPHRCLGNITSRRFAEDSYKQTRLGLHSGYALIAPKP